MRHSRSGSTDSNNSDENSEEFESYQYESEDESVNDAEHEQEDLKEDLLKEGGEAEFLKNKIQRFQDKLAKLSFIDQHEAAKLTHQLVTESTGITTKKCLKLIEIVRAKIELLDNLINLEKMQEKLKSEIVDDKHIHFVFGERAALFLQARDEFRESYSTTLDKFKKMALQFLKSPSDAIPMKDLKLITDTTKNLYNFCVAPQDTGNIEKLIDNAKQIHKKMGTFWNRLKTTLTTVIGIGCIIVGMLGVLPSFGASASLVAVGTMLCASSHVPGFINLQSHQKSKAADEIVSDLQTLLTQAKKIAATSSIPREERSPSVSYQGDYSIF